ncbi:uncharacterized protein RJT20DRAFT_125799 [Scheffersomyces xylosifermentans]|uniref:uncharacterized protein n=1 Tax=Scheffersomyces xylosifermentans TaxID=1304137 RepID=UPI00315D6125
MRAAARLLNRVPLIKFVGGPHPAPTTISKAVKPHPLAPKGEIPGGAASSGSTYFNSNPIEPKEGEFFSRAQLSQRFRYKVPKEDEIEDIISGGAEVVF